MRVKLSNLAMAIDRTGVSIGSAAIIANAVLQDFGIITSSDTSHVIDKSKIVREQRRFHESLASANIECSVKKAIFFDGRKDTTLFQEKKGTKYFRSEKREEHITILEEPKENYLGHVTPESGSAEALLTAIYSFLIQSEFDMEKIGIIYCEQ